MGIHTGSLTEMFTVYGFDRDQSLMDTAVELELYGGTVMRDAETPYDTAWLVMDAYETIALTNDIAAAEAEAAACTADPPDPALLSKASDLRFAAVQLRYLTTRGRRQLSAHFDGYEHHFLTGGRDASHTAYRY